MPPISPTVRQVITPRLPNGLDGNEARAIVNAARREPNPAAALQAVRDEFGEAFTRGGRASFERAAAVALLPSAIDTAPARAATAKAVGTVRTQISSLNAEVARLERSNASKTAQVDALISQIQARRSEIQAEHDRKRNIGIIGALWGMPMVSAASLVMMMDDDSRLRSLNADLSRAQAERSQLQSSLQSHHALKATLTAELSKLEAAARALEALPVPAPRDGTQVGRAAAQLGQGEALLHNLRSQVALLERIRDSARGVGAELDGALARLTLELVRAEKLVTQSRQATFKLVELATAGDPNAAAEKWLEGRVAARTRELLRQHGLDPKMYVDQLVKRAYPQGGPAADLLRRELNRVLSLR
jgi:chaperonin cofactor prefoldin